MGYFSAEQIERLSGADVRAALLVDLNFKSETTRLWNGFTDLEAGGNVYTPMKGAGQIEGLEFSGGIESKQMTFSIPGIPLEAENVLQKALSETDETYQKLAQVFIQFFDNDRQNFGEPLGLAFGYMQKPNVERSPTSLEGGGVQTVSLSAENIFYGRARPPAGRFTPRDQRRRSPTDAFCDFVSFIANRGIRFTYPDY